ncbi:MAG: hypothetical protein KF705_13240 [Phycisphaeraceae bacterium]|nr:hypothetical protein [Phycisphaeraceae bacterium]
MSDAVIRCLAKRACESCESPPSMPMYAAITDPAMVAKPVVISVMICAFVKVLM